MEPNAHLFPVNDQHQLSVTDDLSTYTLLGHAVALEYADQGSSVPTILPHAKLFSFLMNVFIVSSMWTNAGPLARLSLKQLSKIESVEWDIPM